MWMVKYITGLFLVIVFSCSVFAQTYYVDYSAGDDSNNGLTTGTAWKRCPGDPNYSGGGSLSSTDIVIFKGAVDYDGKIATVSGVTYRSGHRHSPQWGTTYAVFNGNNYADEYGFDLGGDSNITIDGFEMTKMDWTENNTGEACIYAGSSVTNLTVENCYIHDNDCKAVDLSVGGNTILIQHNEISWHDNYSCGSTPDCWKAVKIAPSSTGVIFEYNYFHHNGLLHIHGSTSPIIRYNHFEEQSLDVAEHHEDHFQIADSTNVLVYNNLFECPGTVRPDGNCDQGLSFTFGSSQQGTTAEVFNNVITGKNNGAIALRNGNNTPHTYIKLYNNSFYATRDGGRTIGLDSDSNCTVEAYNNAFYLLQDGHTLANKTSGNTYIGDYNYFYNVEESIQFLYEGAWKSLATWRTALGGCPGADNDCNSTEGDPGYSNYTDLTPSSGSPLIDPASVKEDLGAAYDDALAFNTSWDWTSSALPVTLQRPVGASWDIGAYEYGSTEYQIMHNIILRGGVIP